MPILESTGKKKPRRPRRSFTPEFKAEIVGLRGRGDRSVGQVAKDFELTQSRGAGLGEQAEVDMGERNRAEPMGPRACMPCSCARVPGAAVVVSHD